MEPLTRAFAVFDDGRIFKWVVLCLFVLLALAALASALVSDYGLLRQLSHVTFVAGVALLVMAATLTVGALTQAAILLYRGAYGAFCLRAEKYSLVSLVARILRVGAETGFVYFLVLAPGICLATWLGGIGMTSRSPLPMLPTESAFWGGLLAFLASAGMAIGLLCVGYLVAELLELLASIANDVSAIREKKTTS